MRKGHTYQYVRVNSTLSFILISVKKFKFYIIGLFVISTIWSIDISLAPYLLKIMVDRVGNINHQSVLTALNKPLLFYISLLITVFVVSRLDGFIWLKLRPNLQKYIGVKLMKRMMSHSADLYQNHFAGSLVNKINDVTSGIPDILRICVHQLFGNVLTLVIASYTLYQTNRQFAAVFIFWGGAFIVISLKLSAKASNLSNDVADVRSRLVGYKADTLNNIMTIRLFTGKKHETQGLITAFDKLVLAMQERDWFFLKMSAFQGGSFVLYQIICLWLLVIGLEARTITSGDFILVLTINTSLIQILWNFSHYIHDLSEVLGRINQGLNIVLTPIQIKDTEYAEVLKVTDGEIIFEKVKFGYKNSDLLFDNLSIKIDPYQKVGLVGYSGSGKTTFVNLILRLYDINEGRILIDGQNIREVTQTSLRKAVGVIPQDPTLFHRSIKDNIAYSRPEATEEEIINAAKKAQAHQFIIQFPGGYDSLVGERGVKLSGGQRQRIAIARAFLKNPPILVLDEATSQLDSITEGEIQNSLLELFEGKTTLTIAHRLSTLMCMDRILVFKQGEIVEDGSHEELLRFAGLYKAMWDAQVGGFLPEHQ